MKKLIIALTLMIVGCAGPSVKTSFPDLPERLMTTPVELQVIDENSIDSISVTDTTNSEVQLSTLIDVVTKNYTISNRIRQQLLDLQLWLKTQKSINP